MRRYSIVAALPLSLFSRDLYRDVVRSWRGIGLAYLTFIVALLTLVVAVRAHIFLDRFVHGEARAFADQIPRIVVRHRVVEVDRPMPFTIQDSRTGAPLAVIDTTGQVTSLDGLEARVLLTADHIIFRKNAAETRMFNLSSVKNFTLDPALARRWLGLLATWGALLVAPFIFLGLWVGRFVQQLVCALIGLLAGRLTRANLDFSASMRLAVVAQTPALVIGHLLEILRARPPMWGFVWIAITLAYIVWGARANAPGPADAPASDPVVPQAPL